MGGLTNPLLDEINGLSPGAKAALQSAHNAGTSQATTQAAIPDVISAQTNPPKFMGAQRQDLSSPAPDPSHLFSRAPMPVLAPPNPGFAAARQSAQPSPAPSTDRMLPPSQESTVPSIGLSSPQPQVKAPLGTSTGDISERARLLNTGTGVHQIQDHPVLKAAAGIGDYLLSNLLPGPASQIPGTTAHHNFLLGQNTKQTATDLGNEQKQATTAKTQADVPLEQATTAHTAEETSEMPAKAASEQGLQSAQTAHLGAETEEMKAGKPMESSAGLLQVKPDGTAQRITVDGQPVGPPLKTEVKQIEVGGKPHQVLINSLTGDHLRDLGISGEKPIQPPGITMIVPNGAGGGTVQRIGVGGTVAPGAQTAAGVNTMNTPTTTQRTAAGRADTVISMAPEVLTRIDSVASKMGPIAGRWNEFMQGKVGSDDPDFAALRSDLLMMSSAVALAHAQGRLPENLREEFDRAINAPKQTPENLKATINAMIPWLQKVKDQGERPPSGGGASPARPPSVPAGYNWNPQGNGGKGSWQPPKQ
jgi:hypothetical protein